MRRNKYFIYKKIKKGESYYLAGKGENPLQFEKLYPNGYFVHGKTYSVVFSGRFQEETIIRLMRSANLEFRILNLKNSQGMTDTFLFLYENDSCYDQFDHLVNYVQERLKEKNCSSQILSLNERIRLIHRGYLLGKKENYLNVTDYISGILDCRKDFDFEGIDFRESMDNAAANIGGENCSMAVLGVQYYPDDINAMKKVNARLLKNSHMTAGIRIFESIEDRAIINHMKAIYMGLESYMVKLKKTDPEFYQLFYDNTADDTARYTFCGCMVLFCAENEIKLKEELGQLSSEIRKDGGNLIVYHTEKRKLYENIIGARKDSGYTRTIYSRNLEGMVPDCRLESRGTVIDILKKNMV